MTTASAPDRLDQPLYGARFGQAVRRYFRKYATFSGRASRSEYWWTMLFTFVVINVALVPYWVAFVGQMVALVSGSVNATVGNDPTADLAAFMAWSLGSLLALTPAMLISFACFVPSLAIAVRRHHDAGMSGWLVLLNYVTGGVWAWVIGFLGPKLEGLRYEVPGTQQPVVAPELAAMAAYGMPYGVPVGFPPHAQPGSPSYGAQPGAAPQPGPYGQHPHG